MDEEAFYNEDRIQLNKKKRKKLRHKNKINNSQKNCKEKYAILIIFLIIIFYVLYFLFFQLNNNKNLYKKEINIKENIGCIPFDEKLLWENQRRLEINKLRNQIVNSNKYNISFENPNDFYRRENPNISIIMTIYNQENYINQAYAFIQNQELKDIEIIFIDDASTDNSSLIIKNLMEKDKRIVYIKNNINRKQYYSINIGILNSRGEYILVIDPDDLLLNNILIKVYKTAKKYDLDIVQFYMLVGFPKDFHLWREIKYKNGIICNNNDIRNIFYYCKTRNLSDKLIKKKIYLKSISFMPPELYNEDYHMHTDDTIFFGIVHFAQTYGFLEHIGYFYNIDSERRNKIKENLEDNANKNLRSLFNIMKYFFIKSDNNTNEKNNMAYKFFKEKVLKRKENDKNDYINHVTKGFDFFIEVLDMYINCEFFDTDKKNEIKNYKNIIIQRINYVNSIKNTNI